MHGQTRDSGNTVRLDLPASYAYLGLLSACLGALLAPVEGLAEPAITTYNIQLAANEIFANIVGHAYDGNGTGRVAILIRLVDTPRRLEIELRDQGVAFDQVAVVPPDLDDVQVHGYGLFLVGQLMDGVDYERQPGQNCWRLVKYL